MTIDKCNTKILIEKISKSEISIKQRKGIEGLSLTHIASFGVILCACISRWHVNISNIGRLWQFPWQCMLSTPSS